MAKRSEGLEFKDIGIAPKLHKELNIGAKDLKKVFGPDFSKNDFDRVVGWSNHKTKLVSNATLHTWFYAIAREYLRVTGKELKWLDVFKTNYSGSPQGPGVSYIQFYSGRQLYVDLANQFRWMAGQLGWVPEILTGDGTAEQCVANVKAARQNKRHILCGLPSPEAFSELDKAVDEGLAVVTTGCDAKRKFFRLNVADDVVGRWLAEGALAVTAGARPLIFGAENLSYPHSVRLQAISDVINEKNPDFIGLLDQPKYSEIAYEQLKAQSQKPGRVAVISLSRGITAMLLTALDRLNWPEGLLLFTTDFTQDWMPIFERRPQWCASASFDPALLMEVACRLLNIAIFDRSRLPHLRKDFDFPPLFITRKLLDDRKDCEYSNLIRDILSKQRDQIRREMPYLGLTEG